MASDLTVFLPVLAEDVALLDAALHEDPVRWLPDAEATGDRQWAVTLRLGPLQRRVVCDVGVLHTVYGSRWLDISWKPVPQDLDLVPIHQALPAFRGQLGLHPQQAVLVLTGGYDPPGGKVGEFADAKFLRGGARRTATSLLADIVTSATAVPVAG